MKSYMPAAIILTTILSPGVINAASLVIANASFESPLLSPNTSTTGSIPGWQVSYGTNVGVYYPTAPEFPTGAPEGLNVGWVSQAGFSQTLSDTLQGSMDYDLRVLVGRWEIDTSEQYTISLKAGASTLASFSEALSAIPRHTFVEKSLHYVSTGSEPSLGLPLTITLEKNSFREVDFDNVRLDATNVPEPTAIGFAAMGGALLVLRRRRSAGPC